VTTSAQLRHSRVRELIQQIGVGMLTTVDRDGQFVSRPMLALQVDDDPGIYFLTHTSSAKVGQVSEQSRVALTFAGSDSTYLAITGRATVSQDRELIARLWNPTYRAWFPDGAGDRDAAALRVTIDHADYWEAPTSRVVRLVQAIAAVVSHRPYETPKTTVDGP
jgi:general stress protein 26